MAFSAKRISAGRACCRQVRWLWGISQRKRVVRLLRERQAVAAQMRVEGWIGHTDSRAASAFKQAVINDPDGPVRDWPGVLACLQCVSEGIKGQPVKVRVR